MSPLASGSVVESAASTAVLVRSEEAWTIAAAEAPQAPMAAPQAQPAPSIAAAEVQVDCHGDTWEKQPSGLWEKRKPTTPPPPPRAPQAAASPAPAVAPAPAPATPEQPASAETAAAAGAAGDAEIMSPLASGSLVESASASAAGAEGAAPAAASAETAAAAGAAGDAGAQMNGSSSSPPYPWPMDNK